MRLIHDILLNAVITSPVAHSISWEAVQEMAFVLLSLVCLVGGLWAVWADARNRQRATSEAEAYGRRLNALVVAHDERLMAGLQKELERTRSAYDDAIGEHWPPLLIELGKGFGRVEQRITRSEEDLDALHDQSAARLNEALVLMQQVGMAAARSMSR
ncbi:MAG: hypothetical protein ABI432_07920 [Flavobacteriales bacterium]